MTSHFFIFYNGHASFKCEQIKLSHHATNTIVKKHVKMNQPCKRNVEVDRFVS